MHWGLTKNYRGHIKTAKRKMKLINFIKNFTASEQKMRLFKGSVGGLALKLSSTGLNFLSAILMARLLGPTEYGIYSYAMAIIFFMSIPTSLGLPSLVVRYIASYHAKSEWGYIRGLLLTSNKVVIFSSIIILSLAWVSTYFFSDRFKPQQLSTLQAALILLPLMSLSGLRSATLQGLNYTIIAQLPETLLKSIIILSLLYAAYLFLPREVITPVFVMYIQVASTSIAFITGAVLLWKRLPKHVKKTPSNFEYKKWLNSALPFMLFGGVIILNQKTDLLMLGWLSGTYSVGIYEVATRGAEIFIFILVSINVAVGPTMTNLYVTGEIERLRKLITNCTYIISIVSLLLFSFIFYLGDIFINTLFGLKYIDAYDPLIILCIGQLINALLGTIVGQLLIMTGHERETTIGIGFGAVLNVILSYYLIPHFGINGAALASTISLTTGNILLVFFAKKKLNINTTIFQIPTL